jgi:uncharacterized membrane protein YkoI
MRSPTLSRLVLLSLLPIAVACGDSAGPGNSGDPGVAGVENFPALALGTLGTGAVPRLALTGPLDAAGAAARALEIVPGTVTETESDTERGLAVWEVKVRTASGGLVEIKIVAENGAVLELEGETGPFDYEVTPGAPLVNLSTARAAATAAQAGTLKQWELELEEQNRWEYEFYIVAADATVYEIEVNAETGAVTSRKIRCGLGENDGGDSHDDDEDIPDLGPLPDAVRAKALGLVAGSTFVEAEPERENGVIVWEVKILAVGAEIKVHIVPETLALWELQSKEPPYGGDLDPGLGLITLQAARGTAVTASGRPVGELVRWQLQRDESDGNWQWRFRFEGAVDARVRIDAVTGAVTRVDD